MIRFTRQVSLLLIAFNLGAATMAYKVDNLHDVGLFGTLAAVNLLCWLLQLPRKGN